MTDSKKQSTKALKKVETCEREMRQIRALLDGRDTGSGASIKSRLSSAGEGDIRQQVIYIIINYGSWEIIMGTSYNNNS